MMNGEMIAAAKARKSNIHVVVNRADGTVEDWGMVAYWHRNPLFSWPVNFYLGYKVAFLNWRRQRKIAATQ